MKKQNLLLGILIGLLILSCSSDEDNLDTPPLTMEELLIQGSPWTFDHYEVINIVDSGNSNFTLADIENDVNSREDGTVITFNQNGTGSVTIPNEGTDNWDWELINNNQLKLTFASGDSDILDTITITNSQLTIEEQSVSYDEQAQFEVSHKGLYFYQ